MPRAAGSAVSPAAVVVRKLRRSSKLMESLLSVINLMLAFNLEGESMLARFFVRGFDCEAILGHFPFQFFINTKHLYGFDL